MVGRIDLKLLTAVITVARELNYSRAAKKLNISRAELARQIADLESQSGLRIFQMRGSMVEVTEPGAQFVRACCRFLKVREICRTLPKEVSRK